jgi:energy-coupling factor transporter ATP-binding protein EcfA2
VAELMLELAGVSYRYAGAARPSLRELDLQLRDGEVVGVVGPSEAGKSTLCLVASGLAPRTVGGTLTGSVTLDGGDMAPLAMHDLTGRIGITFASPGTQLTGVAGTVFEEVAFGPMNLGLPRDDVIARAWRALEALHVSALAERDPARLSGGQQQLVALAGLLALAPRHLVLDEPTAQLDPAGTRLVAEALGELASGGASILVAEQKTDLLAAVCHRVVALDGGRIVLDGATNEVLRDLALETMGVAPPATVRLARAAERAGLSAAGRSRLGEALGS